MSSRDRIFRSIEKALGGITGDALREGRVIRAGSSERDTHHDKVTAYLEAVRRNGTSAAVFAAPREFSSWFVGLCQGMEAGRVYIGGGNIAGLHGDELGSTLRDAGCVPFVQEENGAADGTASRSFLTECDIALTEAWGGCIDSGIAAITSSPVEARGATVLPPTHVLLLKRDRIVLSMDELLGRMRELLAAGRPAAITFIGGPSRTADIEKVLVVGVHGPKSLHLCIL